MDVDDLLRFLSKTRSGDVDLGELADALCGVAASCPERFAEVFERFEECHARLTGGPREASRSAALRGLATVAVLGDISFERMLALRSAYPSPERYYDAPQLYGPAMLMIASYVGKAPGPELRTRIYGAQATRRLEG